jgi:enolase
VTRAAFAPNVSGNDEAIELILKAIETAGYTPGQDVVLGLDCASSEFYKDGKYILASEKLELSSEHSPTTWRRWPTATRSSASRTAWPKATGVAGRLLTDKLGKKVQIVGDDLFVTNPRILKEGIQKGIANSILIKINQIGSLTETFAAVEMAKRAGYTAVISHRSGETEDSHHRRHRGRPQRRPDQDRIAQPLGSHRQVQPAAAHRGRPRRYGHLSRARRVLQPEEVSGATQ